MPYTMPGLEQEFTSCKANALPIVPSLRFLFVTWGGAGQDLTVLRDFSWLHAHVIPKFTWGTICDTKIKSGLVKATTITVAISIFQSTLVKIYLYDKKTSILLRQFYRNSGK